jgi:3-oxoacyl-[acyl-carrier-protein] synthase-3
MAKIIGVGHYVPEKVILNEDISSNPAWVAENTGIKERRIVQMGQTSSSLAVVAGSKALEMAGIKDVDVVIVATATPDMIAPSTACMVRQRLNLKGAAFDINAVCSGFLYAMTLGHTLIDNGAESILIIGVDTFSKITDWNRRDNIFFGDGAGAVVMGKVVNVQGMFIGASDGNAFMCEQGQKFVMHGKLVYNAALDLIPKAVKNVLRRANIGIEEIDYMVPHQPSIRILNDVADKIGLPREKVLMNMDKYANTSAGTIPILLSESWGKFKQGDKLLFAVIGSGWTYGALIYEI